MKTIRLLVPLLATTLLMSCSDRKAAEEKARQNAEAQARADAARKEMQVLPQTFQPRYNQRLDATASTNGAQTAPPNASKTP